MYVADDLVRINETGKTWGHDIPAGRQCDFCNRRSIKAIPIYNPADEVRGVTGAYGVIHVCNQHNDDDFLLEDCFYCSDCGKLFINNHSWDSLVCVIDGEQYCHKCALNHINPIKLSTLKDELLTNKTTSWKRINNYPGKESLWSGEFSQWSDFPGHTSLQTIAKELNQFDPDTLVYPFLVQTLQFSVVLEIFKD